VKSPKRWNILAILLIVLGVGATVGGVYGQVFLAENEGHHDDREPTFALQSQVGAYDLTVRAGGGTITPTLSQAGQTVTEFDGLHGTDGPHVFVVSEGLDWFTHITPEALDEPVAVAGPAIHRVIMQANPSGGPDLLEMGVTTDQISGDDFAAPGDFAVGDVYGDPTTAGLTVTRQGFDFVLSEPWNGDEVYDGPAFLTLIRAEDFAFTHAHAELVGDNRFSFASDLPGLGDYLAALEFEQDGDLVTALFRFTL
jgi:hypothetical protein